MTEIPPKAETQFDNSELSAAIVQTFNLLGRCSPHSEELKRTLVHYYGLLAERDARLSKREGRFITTSELKAMAEMERWKAEHGPIGAKDGFLARAELIEQLVDELEREKGG